MKPEDRWCVSVLPQGWEPPRPTARGWTYWVPSYIDGLKLGDWVIVETPRDERGRLVEDSGMPILAEVTELNPPRDIRKLARKWIVGKVDWEPYRALKALAPVIEGDD